MITKIVYWFWSAVIGAWDFCFGTDVDCMICNGRCLKHLDMDDPDSRIVEPPDVL